MYLLLWLIYLFELVVVKLVLALPRLIRGQFLDFETMSERASHYKFTAGLECQVQWSTFYFNIFSLTPCWLFCFKVRSTVYRRTTQEMSNETNKWIHNFQGNLPPPPLPPRWAHTVLVSRKKHLIDNQNRWSIPCPFFVQLILVFVSNHGDKPL